MARRSGLVAGVVAAVGAAALLATVSPGQAETEVTLTAAGDYGATNATAAVLAGVAAIDPDAHLALGDLTLRLPRRSIEQVVECGGGHRQSLTVVEVAHVQPKRPIFFQIDQMRENHIFVNRLAIRSQTHHFVFPAIDAKSSEIGERGIQKSKRMRETNFADQVNFVLATNSDARSGPFADTIDRQDCGFVVG